MKVSRVGLAVALAAALGSCATPRREPPPPPPVELPSQRPPPPVTPPTVAWQDAPLSPGDWSYSQASSTASFGVPGQPSFTIRCEPTRQVTLSRSGTAASAALMIRTSSVARTLAARAAAGAVSATVAASDPLLDAIIFSRGRFAVEAAGLPALIVPAWPEAARVVEDCRS